MDIGVPTEIKDQETRVGLTPDAVRALTEAGHRVWVQSGAGEGSDFSDEDYHYAGATIARDAATAWARELVVKVKEPLASEYGFLAGPRWLFTYLHLAAERSLTEALIASGIGAIAYETVETPDRRLPLLAPMSAIAGRLAVQLGARLLEKPAGGRGLLLGGIPGVAPGRVTILGGGVVGTEAAKMAVGLGARVRILDLNVARLNQLGDLFGSRVELIYSSTSAIERAIVETDLLIGAVLVPGKRAPRLVRREWVGQMPVGSALVDVAIDQGGCIETIRPTSHANPSYREAGVVHCAVPNLPGAVPYTSTQALNNATLPYVLALANGGEAALERDPALARGVNVAAGAIVHPGVAEAFADLPARI